MKQLKCSGLNLLLLIISLFTSGVLLAQDDTKKIDVDITTKDGGGNFFMQPWVWVVGGAVFILLLIALLKGGKKE